MAVSSKGSKEPTPMLANPSVQSTTEDPGLPFEATSIEDNKAGPNAVCPFAYVLVKLLIKFSKD